ncbi:17834_t:CDS:2, partial [Dentiscutata erythropus]
TSSVCATEPLLNDKIKPKKVIREAFDLICNSEKIIKQKSAYLSMGQKEFRTMEHSQKT